MAVSLIFTGYYRHPKFLAANGISGGELSEVLWCRGLDYVSQFSREGQIPYGVPEILTPSRTNKRVKGLVEADLWRPIATGWQVVPYPTIFEVQYGTREDRRARIPVDLRLAVYDRDGYRCLVCLTTKDLSLDHIIPWSHGGPDTFENLRTLCKPCNSRRGTRPVTEPEE